MIVASLGQHWAFPPGVVISKMMQYLVIRCSVPGCDTAGVM